MGWPDARDLLAGPHGRRLCWSLLDLGGSPGGARTMLAGWDPDQTYWLTDILTLAGSAVTWLKTDAGWIPA
jgi:hypothetical protein